VFHPHIFKTTLCEEHTNNTGNKERQTRNAKKNRCHRYYCPFAHGQDELRTSPLSAEQREKCLRSMEAFPSDVCCVVCTRHWITPAVNDQTKFPGPLPEAPGLTLLESQDPMLWARSPKGPSMISPWDLLATVPNPMMNVHGDMMLKQNKDVFARKEKLAKGLVPSPIQKPTEDPFPVPYRSIGDLFYGAPLSELRVSQMTMDSPAFIDLAPPELVGQRLSTKMPQDSQYDLPKTEGEYYFAML